MPIAASSLINTGSSTPSVSAASPSDLGTVVEVTMFSAPPSPLSGSRNEEEPCPIVESSIEEPVLGDITLENPNNHHVTFQLVEEGSKRRKTKLVDSLGYSYNVRSKRSYATYWQCVVRPRENACKATVIQRDGNFHSGENAHNHTAEVGAMTAAKIVNLVKEKALEDKFKPASAIVEEDLDFQLMEDCIPEGFFQADVYVKERRHLIFATVEQLMTVADSS